MGFRIWHRLKEFNHWARAGCYPATGDIVVKTVHGFNVIVDGSETDRTPRVIFGDEVELRDEIALKKILHGGDWVIDVGSKSGSFCMLAAQRVNSFGRVFAYQREPKIAGLITRSSVINRMHDRVIVRTGAVKNPKQAVDETLNTPWPELDQEFPVDLPIKLLNIDVQSEIAAVLKGAQRLLERRCIDFVHIGVLKEAIGELWRRELGGTRLNQLLTQLSCLIEAGYVVCTISRQGSFIEHKSVTAALDRLEGRNIILKARDQHTATATSP